MVDKIYNYKTLKISEKAHSAILKLSEGEGLTLKDYIEKLSDVLIKNGVKIGDIPENNLVELNTELKRQTDRIITVIRSQEKNILNPIFRVAGRVEQNLMDFFSKVELASTSTEPENIEKFETTSVRENEDESLRDWQIKVEKERLKVNRAVEIMEMILRKTALGKGSGLAVRRFEQDEIEILQKYVRDNKRE